MKEEIIIVPCIMTQIISGLKAYLLVIKHCCTVRAGGYY